MSLRDPIERQHTPPGAYATLQDVDVADAKAHAEQPYGRDPVSVVSPLARYRQINGTMII